MAEPIDWDHFRQYNKRDREGRKKTHTMCDRRAPTEVKFELVSRAIVGRNSGLFDSPSVSTIPASFRGSQRGSVGWMIEVDWENLE